MKYDYYGNYTYIIIGTQLLIMGPIIMSIENR